MYLVGADPELFVRKNGVLQSAFGLVFGTKKAPQPVERGAVQVDGMALEFNIDPAKSCEEFSLNIKTVLAQLKGMVPDYDFEISPVAEFGQEYIATQPEEARELGCDPDYNAYTGEENPRPDGDRGFRTASGHIHVGFCDGADKNDPTHLADCRMVVRQLDYYLGVPSLLLDPDQRRRELYGKAGAFRAKPYGVEYRVLSNFWLRSDDAIEWVYKQTMLALRELEAGNIAPDCQHIIDGNLHEQARLIVETEGWGMPCLNSVQ